MLLLKEWESVLAQCTSLSLKFVQCFNDDSMDKENSDYHATINLHQQVVPFSRWPTLFTGRECFSCHFHSSPDFNNHEHTKLYPLLLSIRSYKCPSHLLCSSRRGISNRIIFLCHTPLSKHQCWSVKGPWAEGLKCWNSGDQSLSAQSACFTHWVTATWLCLQSWAVNVESVQSVHS